MDTHTDGHTDGQIDLQKASAQRADALKTNMKKNKDVKNTAHLVNFHRIHLSSQ